MTTYDEGFVDGLKWVAACLRAAATQAEEPIRGDFENKNGGGYVNAIAKMGHPSFAKRLRDVADVIESATKGKIP